MVQITITVSDEGGFNVSGAIDNLIPALGMLEMAKVAIVDHAKQKEQRVQLAPASALLVPKN